MYTFYPKLSPIAGLTGFGGGIANLTFTGAAYVTTGKWYGNRGITGGGKTNSGYHAGMDYFNIASAGNASSFGNLTTARRNLGAASDSIKGVFAAGDTGSKSNVIDYVTIASTSNASDFGDLTAAIAGPDQGCSDGGYGLFSGGADSSTNFRTQIEYITIASTGNAGDFGDLTLGRGYHAACADATRGVMAGGGDQAHPNPPTNTIDYVTIATPGNSTDFGDLNNQRKAWAGCSSTTRGVFGGGSTAAHGQSNDIYYITIDTTGDSSDFGNLTRSHESVSSCSNATIGVWTGGYHPRSNTMDYVTIASTGDASDFGDLVNERTFPASCAGDT